MNYRKIAALAALANKRNKAGESATEAKATAEGLLASLDDVSVYSAMTGGLAVVRSGSGVQLMLYLGMLRENDDE